MPGVGKSELASKLVGALVDKYPDGWLYANLGAAGQPRLPGNVLKTFLRDLGFELYDENISTADAAAIFRSLTANRRILVFLDAARNSYQVEQLLPAGTRCAAIVTSRPNIGPAFNAESLHLQVPEPNEALDVLRAISGTDESVRPECAVKVIELCGRLPPAIRSVAARVGMDGTDLCQISELLQAKETRLDWLSYGGRGVRDRIESDFLRLPQPEQEALSLLTLIRSRTFAPWTLAPLRGISLIEAENLVAYFSTIQLLDMVGDDDLTGLPRYSFHPLVRLVAEAAVKSVEADRRATAQEDLDQAYLKVIAAALKYTDAEGGDGAIDDPPPTLAGFAISPTFDFSEAWIEAEYRNLINAVGVTDQRGDLTMCWNIAAKIGNCVDGDTDVSDVLEAFAVAKKAAYQDDDWTGPIDVNLALGSFLSAVESYDEAHGALREANTRAEHFRLSSTDQALIRASAGRQAVAWRKLGESYMQMGSFREASSMLQQAYPLAETSGDQAEKRLIRLLQAESHEVDSSSPSYGVVLDNSTDSQARYRAYLGLAESERRRGNLLNAVHDLNMASRAAHSNARRKASLQYRLARLYISPGLSRPGSAGGPLRAWRNRQRQVVHADASLTRGIRHAARAVVAFQQIKDGLGVVRARALLGRALIAARHLVEADHMISMAEADLDLMLIEAGPAHHGLSARVKLARGELMLGRGFRRDAHALLSESATLFAQEGDWSEQRHAMTLLERTPGDPPTGAANQSAPGAARSAQPSAEADPSQPSSDETARLMRAEIDRMGNVLRQIDDRLQGTMVPETPTAFVGVMGASLVNAREGGGNSGPLVWTVPAGVKCDLSVFVGTGQDYYAGDRTSLPPLPGVSVWRGLAVKSGREGESVDLEVVIDAPLAEVPEPRVKRTVAVDGAKFPHRTNIRVARPGTSDLRIALFSSGRLVQALPIDLIAVDPGEQPIPPLPDRT
jgi:tetratricopeptide (TPR) repeat protein